MVSHQPLGFYFIGQETIQPVKIYMIWLRSQDLCLKCWTQNEILRQIYFLTYACYLQQQSNYFIILFWLYKKKKKTQTLQDWCVKQSGKKANKKTSSLVFSRLKESCGLLYFDFLHITKKRQFFFYLNQIRRISKSFKIGEYNIKGYLYPRHNRLSHSKLFLSV